MIERRPTLHHPRNLRGLRPWVDVVEIEHTRIGYPAVHAPRTRQHGPHEHARPVSPRTQVRTLVRGDVRGQLRPRGTLRAHAVPAHRVVTMPSAELSAREELDLSHEKAPNALLLDSVHGSLEGLLGSRLSLAPIEPQVRLTASVLEPRRSSSMLRPPDFHPAPLPSIGRAVHAIRAQDVRGIAARRAEPRAIPGAGDAEPCSALATDARPLDPERKPARRAQVGSEALRDGLRRGLGEAEELCAALPA